MKAVLISIQPKWVDKIANGKKTIEVRKSRPKLETPFKVYIYCTYGNAKENYCVGKRGKVIGEFVCDSFYGLNNFLPYDGEDCHHSVMQGVLEQTCLEDYEIDEYLGKKDGYGWHISDLKIYDKPKELGEFKKENVCYKSGDWETLGCWEGGCVHQELGECDGRCSVLYRPPQNWCYVEAK